MAECAEFHSGQFSLADTLACAMTSMPAGCNLCCQTALSRSMPHVPKIERRQHTWQVFDALQGLVMARAENTRDALRRLRIQVNAVGAYIHRCQSCHRMVTVLLQIGTIEHINIGRCAIGDDQQDFFSVGCCASCDAPWRIAAPSRVE